MKIIFCLLAVLVLAVFGAPPVYGAKKMTPEMQKVVPISQTDNCEFIKTVYFEVSSASKIHYYAAKNTVKAGGDSYKILTSSEDYSGQSIGLIGPIHTTNITIYKCKSPPKQTNSTPPEKSKSPPKIDLRYLSDDDSDAEGKGEGVDNASYIDELIALGKLRDDGILTEAEFQEQKAKVLARE